MLLCCATKSSTNTAYVWIWTLYIIREGVMEISSRLSQKLILSIFAKLMQAQAGWQASAGWALPYFAFHPPAQMSISHEDNLQNEINLKNKDNLKNEEAVRSNTSQLLYHWATSTCLKEGGRMLTDNQIPRSCS